MNLKGLLTNHKDAKPAETQEKWETEETEKCTLQLVPSVVHRPKYRLGQVETGRFTVASVSLKREKMRRVCFLFSLVVLWPHRYGAAVFYFGEDAIRTKKIQVYVATCAKCSAQAKVPFKPKGDRPVYCGERFSKKRENAQRLFALV